MWEMRAIDYFTQEPTGDWFPTTEGFFCRNMGTKWVHSGRTKQESINWYKNHPGQVFKGSFKEFRYSKED